MRNSQTSCLSPNYTNSHGYGSPNVKLQLGACLILGQVVGGLSLIPKFVPKEWKKHLSVPEVNEKICNVIVMLTAISSSSLILTFAVSHLR